MRPVFGYDKKLVGQPDQGQIRGGNNDEKEIIKRSYGIRNGTFLAACGGAKTETTAAETTAEKKRRQQQQIRQLRRRQKQQEAH